MYQKEKNEKDVRYILEHLREEDKHEALIQLGEDYVNKCLENVMNDNNEDFLLGCKKSDNTPVCMGGCVPSENDSVGIVWLLATPEIEKNKICFMRHLKEEMIKYERKYWITYNFIYKENFFAKSYLKKFGYQFRSRLEGIHIPDDFELFYKIRQTRGLNNGTSTAVWS